MYTHQYAHNVRVISLQELKWPFPTSPCQNISDCSPEVWMASGIGSYVNCWCDAI